MYIDNYTLLYAFTYAIAYLIIAFVIVIIPTNNNFNIKNWILLTILICLFSLSGQLFLYSFILHTLVATSWAYLSIRIVLHESRKISLAMAVYTMLITGLGEFGFIFIMDIFYQIQIYEVNTGPQNIFLVSLTFTSALILHFSTIVPLFWRILEYKKVVPGIIFLSALPFYQLGLFFLCIYIFDSFSFQMFIIGNVYLIMNIIITILLFQTIDSLIKIRSNKNSLFELQEKRKAEYQYYQNIQNQAKEEHLLRHEFINQLQVLHLMILDDSSRKDAITFLNSIDNQSHE